MQAPAHFNRYVCFEGEMYNTFVCHSSREIRVKLAQSAWLDSEIAEMLRLQSIALSSRDSKTFVDYCLGHCDVIQAKLPCYAHSQEDIDTSQGTSFNRFVDLLDGKRVALVGPSEGLYLRHESGAEIDSFDLVVRMNPGWPTTQEYHHITGNRTDILIHCCNGDLPLETSKFSTDNKLKFFCYQFGLDAPAFNRYMLSQSVPTLNISCIYGELGKKMNTCANTGTVAIHLLLKTALKELHLYGISALTEPYLTSYRGHGAQIQKSVDLEKSQRHGKYPQIQYLKNTALTDSRLAYDDCFMKVLQGGSGLNQRN